MAKTIFINLPVSDLARSTAFYQAIGAVKNEAFSDGACSCIKFSETIQVMLMTHDKYRFFTSKKIADPRTMSSRLALPVRRLQARGRRDDRQGEGGRLQARSITGG